MAESFEDVYLTLLLNDAYLPGALVLAHSLRDAGTTKRLGVLVTLSGVSEPSVTELKKIYDYVIPVENISSIGQHGLNLMERPDLHSALTKIHVFNQVQFRKVVYLDADVLALRAPDELFDIDAEFAASPDVGWPDCFNSGVFVTKPSSKTFEELKELASRGETFDGADQGLLNQYFPNWHRLPFVYNCTVANNMAYQYAPAFNHYGKNVTLAHFIGSVKPWARGYTPGLSGSGNPYERLSSKWWDVSNKYLGSQGGAFGTKASGGSQVSQAQFDSIIQAAPPRGALASGLGSSSSNAPNSRGYTSPTGYAFTATKIRIGRIDPPASPLRKAGSKGSKFVPIRSIDQPSRYHENFPGAESPPQKVPVLQAGNQSHHQQYSAEGQVGDFVMTKDGPVAQSEYFQTGATSFRVQKKDSSPAPSPKGMAFSAPRQHWDPTQSAPPQHGAPEADQFHVETYENEWDKPATAPGSPRAATPSFAPPPTHHLWYDVPNAAPEAIEAPAAKPLFPWEAKPRTVARVFTPPPHPPAHHEPEYVEEPVRRAPAAPKPAPKPAAAPTATVGPSANPVFPWEQKSRTVTRVFSDELPVSPLPHSQQDEEDDYDEDDYADEEEVDADDEGDSWRQSYSTRENKWDTDPAIRDYVLGLRRRRIPTLSDVPVVPGAMDDVPQVAPPAPRRPSQVEEVESVPSWDPERKLDELRRLPKGYVTRTTESEGVQTDDGEFSSGESSGSSGGGRVQRKQASKPKTASSVYNDSATQTDRVKVAHKGVQYPKYVRVKPVEDESSESEEDTITPKLSELGLSARFQSDGFSFEDINVDLKTIAGIPAEIRGGRTMVRAGSIDSAFGSLASSDL